MAKLLSGISDLYSYCQNNDLQYLLEEWDYQNNHGKTPSDFTYGSNKKVFWKCKDCGKPFPARISTRVRDRTQVCSECAKNRAGKLGTKG